MPTIDKTRYVCTACGVDEYAAPGGVIPCKKFGRACQLEKRGLTTTSPAEERKATPIYSGFLKYFPDAMAYVSQVSKAGNDQHNPGKPLHWDRSKSGDELDALTRHLIDHSTNPVDTDGLLHLGKVAWRGMAVLQKYLEGIEECTK